MENKMHRKYGQNFLIDHNVANNIILSANLKKHDNVLEIGPGTGVLTRIIQKRVNHLTAVEIDSRLAKYLASMFSDVKNIKIINSDFLEYRIEINRFKIVSNLPYCASTAIIQRILPLDNWTSAVLMVQKEVAERLSANPNTGSYGYISVITSHHAECKVLFDVSPHCFNPKPSVISSVIRLTNKNKKQPDKMFFELIKHFFSMRRKTILNCLTLFKPFNLKKKNAIKIICSCNLNPLLRPENLCVSDFFCLTNKIKNIYL
jgi:16S rRNA (adenine1518-N6/adenine1519-N6)-dimethyltransferase